MPGGDRRGIGRKVRKVQRLPKSSGRQPTRPSIRARVRALRLSTKRCRNGVTRLCVGAAACRQPSGKITIWPPNGIVVISNSLWAASISNSLASRAHWRLIRYRHASNYRGRMWKHSLPPAKMRYEQIRRFTCFLTASTGKFLRRLPRQPNKGGGCGTADPKLRFSDRPPMNDVFQIRQSLSKVAHRTKSIDRLDADPQRVFV